MAGSTDKLLGTIEAVHAAGLDESLWPHALASIARLFGARAATLEDFEKRPMRLRYLRTAGVPPQGETAYLDHYATNNSRAQYAFRNLSKRMLCDYDFTNERAMDRDPYYAKYLGPLDLRYFLSGQIANCSKFQAIVSIQRTRRQGHIGSSDAKLMNLLVPHCRQAFDVTKRIAEASAATQTLAGAINWLEDGAALLRADGSIAYANDALCEMARRRDGLRLAAGYVEFSAGETQSRFTAALRALAQFADGDARMNVLTDFPVARPTGAPAYILSLRPLARSQGHGAMAMLFVHDPLSPRSGAHDLLRAAYGLTDAESGLAIALCEGISPVQYARTNQLSTNTVYTYLRRIKEKTRTSRQAELIKKLNAVQPSLRAMTNARKKRD